MEITLQDLRYGLRQLRKNPGFTTIAVLTLALGIAVNTTMFSLVSAFLLRRPPGREPERVAVVSAVDPAQGFQADATPVSAPNYLALREANRVFVDVAASDENRPVSLTAQNQSEALLSAAVSPNYFSLLDVAPQLGRTFQAGEDRVGQDHVMILSHDLWQRRFASDASIIGSTVRLNREPYTVIGVMPASFRLMGFTPQLWTPLTLSPTDQTPVARKSRSLFVFGRLKPDATLEQARAEMMTFAHRAEENFPDTEKGWGVAVRTLPDFLIYGFGIRGALAVMMTTVGFVLMIACANVAGLLLARAAGRRKELAIRSALGAGRLRVLRQLLTEGLVIACLGGGLGVLLASWGIRLVRASLNFNAVIIAVPFSLDWKVLLFAAAISLLCALLCSLAPSWNASRTDITANLKDETRSASPSRSHRRLRTVMVTGEIALALFLLVGTGLLLRGIFLIDHQYLGFQADHLLTAGITLDSARYQDATRQKHFVQDLISRLQSLPGAEAVAATSDLPATGMSSVTLHLQGQSDQPSSQPMTTGDCVITPDYLRTAGVSLLRGRAFTEDDNAIAPRVVLVNQEFVRKYLPGQEPLGKQIRLEVIGAPSQWSQIVGVVSNVKWYSESPREEPEVYESFLQRPVPSLSLMLRTASNPDVLASALHKTVAEMDVELPLARVMSMPAVINTQRAGNPFFLRVMGTFALLALILSAIGIYGLIAYTVGQRSHEIGIRMALGAKRHDVLQMILREGLKMTAIGSIVGLAMAIPLPRVFRSLFFDLQVNEPRVYFIVPLAILVVALVATYVPACRAAAVDPMDALRQE